MSIDYERYYQPKPGGDDGWDGERSVRWHQLGAVLKADHVMDLLRRAGVGDVAGLSVLEVGCGDGHVLAELARRGLGPEIVGVEISHTAAELARHHPEVTRVETFDGDTLPFGDRAFDLVLATHVLEHVPRPLDLLREMARVAQRLVVVEVPLERNLAAQRPHAMALSRHVGHVQQFDRAAVRKLIADAGLARVAELSDPLPRRVRAFHDGTVRGSVKWAVRALVARLPQGERLMTVHYAAVARRP